MRCVVTLALLPLLVACTGAPKPIARPVAPQSPPHDAGKQSSDPHPAPSEAHAAALEQLLVAPVGLRADRQKSINVALPDQPSWRRVRFLGVKSLVGFRYGTEHHAVAGAFILDVKNRTPETCNAAFEDWIKPWLDLFDVRYDVQKPVGFTWKNSLRPNDAPSSMAAVTVKASTASMLSTETYFATYAIYPAWPDKCLVVGMASTARGEDDRAQKARDRFAADTFGKLEILTEIPPTKSY